MADQQDKSVFNLNKSIEKQMLTANLFAVASGVTEYQNSSVRRETYESLVDDSEYQKYIIKTYGSYANFLKSKKLFQDVHIFDPTEDYILDVTIIKKEVAYKTDHLSAQEVIMENLTGVCSVWFMKEDGSTRRLNCTLKKDYMTDIAIEQRASFFVPQKYDRIGVWDINEQKWKSFYMGRVFKFVRDDTFGLE